jgi:hypothetical protein
MTPTLDPELKIEGAQFPIALASTLRARLDRVQQGALIIGLLALAVTACGLWFNSSQFFFSYLFGELFWLQLALGCFLLAMIHHLTGGRWGYPARRFFEAGFMTLPLLLVLFIPVFFGLHQLYPWARAGEVAAEKVLSHRHAYQNQWAYIGRTVFCLAVWTWMAWCLRRWSRQQDATTDAGPTRKSRRLSGVGIVIYSLMATFAHIDWIMSLEKHWYSTMFAVVVIIGQILLGLAFSVILLTRFRVEEPLVRVIGQAQYHQLGNLLLAFVLFWTYVSFGELLIIYSGDLPHELDWYLHRIAAGWKYMVAALGLFHFFLPFYLLLFRAVKKHVAPITALAAVLFVAHIVSVYWMVLPALHPNGVRMSWLDFSAPIGIGGLWLSLFLANLKAAPLLPQHDPGLQFAFRYAN